MGTIHAWPARGLVALLLAVAPLAAVSQAPAPPGPPPVLDRTVLPIAEPVYPPITELDARKATPPPRFEIRAPAGAPNVLLILVDDMGFGMPSAFGGMVRMPTTDRLAAGGLRYTQFHTTALCSPTRTALLSGRNHHTNNMGGITEMATAFPGNTGQRPDSVAPLAEMLRLNGYSTAFFGKNHETPTWEVSPSGPTTRWPNRSGFDEFYGFMGAETNQWAPLVYHNLAPVERTPAPGYHFMNDMTNRAIAWVQVQKALTPDRPFFVYFAPGATHSPHHVAPEWIAKYRGKFDAGWDVARKEILERQLKLGVAPPGTRLAAKPGAIRDWVTLSPDERRLFARQMEVYAAFAEYTDHEIGRLVDALRDMGLLEDTLVFYILGDNGTSAEGGMNGLFNEMTYVNSVPESVPDILKRIDELGSPTSFPHMAAGWAVAGDTPFTWTKQVASNFGGTRNGMIVHWPRRIAAKGEIRPQFHHVIHVAPTILEAAGLPEPRSVNGVVQKPIEGVSMAYTFADARAPSRHRVQYFEMIGNRAIYADGWLAGTVHKLPWDGQALRPLLEDRWELYDTRYDFSLSNDLSARHPEKLKELQQLFLAEAVKYSVLPIDDRLIDRLNARIAGRPDVMGQRTSLELHEGMTGLLEDVFINVKNRSVSITADLDVPDGGGGGAILAQGGRFGGWALHLRRGKLVYSYNFLGMERTSVSSRKPLPAGPVTVTMEFAYDGGGIGKGGLVTLLVNGKKVGEGRIPRTQPIAFSAEDGTDVGMDEGTPVVEDYDPPSTHFNGSIRKVVVEVKEMGPFEKSEARKAAAEAARKRAVAD
ncbi:MAG TPA: arylsulfatase [Anaeromyxobacteraceae bacterium]|nr:arylsulfatase [Anaeromyxobacteraceae bacterium]